MSTPIVLPSDFLERCIKILEFIADGHLADRYENGVYIFDAWDAFNGAWRSDKDMHQQSLTPLHRSILGEFWYILESADPNPSNEERKSYESTWPEVQVKAKELHAMLLDTTLDTNEEPFEDWLRCNPPGPAIK